MFCSPFESSENAAKSKLRRAYTLSGWRHRLKAVSAAGSTEIDTAIARQQRTRAAVARQPKTRHTQTGDSSCAGGRQQAGGRQCDAGLAGGSRRHVTAAVQVTDGREVGGQLLLDCWGESPNPSLFFLTH